MLTVKVYLDGGIDVMYYVFELVDQNTNQVMDLSNNKETFSESYEALLAGAKMAEELNGVPFPADQKIEIIEESFSEWKSVNDVLRQQQNETSELLTYQQNVRKDAVDQYIEEYKKRKGKISVAKCRILFDIFGDFVSKAVCGDPADRIMEVECELRNVSYRDVAFDRWVEFVKRIGYTKKDAEMLWEIVDSIHTLS